MRRLDADQLESLDSICREYEIALTGSPEALSYLHGRGVSTASAERFRLGLVEDPSPRHRTVSGRLAIPTIKRAGVTGFEFRCIKDECLSASPEDHIGHGKYQTFEPQTIYNVEALDNSMGLLAITEGRLDALILDGECGIPTVGLPGVNSWKPHFRELLKEFPQLFIFGDNDALKKGRNCRKCTDQGLAECKGHNVGDEFAEFLKGQLPQAIGLQMPIVVEGESSDVTKVYCAYGREYLRDMIGLK